jgi:alpha-amylase
VPSTLAEPTCQPISANGSSSPASAAGSLTAPGWWRDRVFYEVFVRSFADADGDGIGDLRGLTGRLDYLNDGDAGTTTDLGVTGIWLMPVAESPSYHGYDVVDERAIERDYGTIEDMRALVAAAHERGIAVVTDLVLNHTSDENPWFVDALTPGSVHEDWYVWSPTNPGYGGPDGQAVWHSGVGRFYYAVFGEHLPDLNLRNPAVTAELEDVARFWLEDIGIDGFRLDAIKHLVEDGRSQIHTPETHAWLTAFRQVVKQADAGALLVGEVYDLTAAAAQYVPEDVDLVFDFGLAAATIDAIERGEAAPLLGAADEAAGLFGPGERATFLTNHDQERIGSDLDGDEGKLRLAAGLLLTSPGVPFIYYGEEIGLTGEKPDERIRTPMPWDGTQPAAGFSTAAPWEPLEEGWQARNVATQTGQPNSLLSTYRDLIRLRSERPALRNGEAIPVASTSEAVVAVLHASGPERLLVIANLSGDPVDGYGLSLAAGSLCGSPHATMLYSTSMTVDHTPTGPTVTAAGGFSAYQPVATLPPRSISIVALQP